MRWFSVYLRMHARTTSKRNLISYWDDLALGKDEWTPVWKLALDAVLFIFETYANGTGMTKIDLQQNIDKFLAEVSDLRFTETIHEEHDQS